MKQFKILNYLLVAVLCLGFASCSDDDDDYDPAELVGTWQWVRSEGWEINDEGKRVPFDEDYTEDLDFYVFNADNTGYYYWGGNPANVNDDFTWSLKGNKITISYGEPYSGYIVELNKNRVVVEYSWEDEYTKDTYIRTK